MTLMEQEDDSLLFDDNHQLLDHPINNKNDHRQRIPMHQRLTDTLRSWKQMLYDPLSSSTTSSVQEKLLEHNHHDGIDNNGNSEDDIDLDDDWYTHQLTTRPTRRKRWLRWMLSCICVSLGLPLGFLLLVFIVYAIAFHPPPTIQGTDKWMMETNMTQQPARFLTFNIFMRPPGVKNNENDYKDERLMYIIDTILPHYDVITFQEAFAFGNHRVDRLIEAAQRLGFGYIMSPRHGPWELAADGGLLLLSRYRIVQADILEYPRGLHSDWLSYKGALHALIELDTKQGTMIHVYTTHTQASYGDNGTRSQQDILMRLEQFSRLHQFIHNTTNKNATIPIIAMGDFNIDSADHSSGNITLPSTKSSLAYTMMMDVLTGKGIDDSFFTNDDHKKLRFADDWQLSFTDMLYQTFGYHPVTFGDYYLDSNNNIHPSETTLTHAKQLLTVQSIDQLLWSPTSTSHLRLSNVTIEKFLVSNEPFTQLSDHYGISCLVSPTLE
ncbi:Endonuclease/exonuclease/phosphatase [Halteromyces radiatus]|uniref:Endonuclease/exonuclease/phosphatase n=1 Tax=Halteromyces radiatus TaxID=101107 RepID=UPI00221E3D8D|nr:Endonuclease/exonuclease/phosphatase [Halteromyces radiatus]KAI8097048.1 Endonuclease/exonuclease/phosphatase [Halteromyces radiatus]